jgi:hypothetical protein
MRPVCEKRPVYFDCWPYTPFVFYNPGQAVLSGCPHCENPQVRLVVLCCAQTKVMTLALRMKGQFLLLWISPIIDYKVLQGRHFDQGPSITSDIR